MAENATGGEQQSLDLTVQEALVVRGAINVLRELASRHDLDPRVAVPLNSGRASVFQEIRSRLNNRVGGRPTTATITEILDPAEAQAVRDAAGVLSTLLRDAGGREILASVGFLPAPDADVDREEAALLDDVADRLEPTGVRTTTGTATGRAETELINPTRSLAAITATAEAELANAELPWPGLEQAVFSLRGTQDSAPDLDCSQALKTLVATAKLATAGARQLPPEDRDGFAADVEDAFGAISGALRNGLCLPTTGMNTIDADTARLVASLEDAGDTIAAAEQLLADLQDVAPTPPSADPAALTGTAPRTHPSTIDDPHRRRIEQLREETRAVIDRTRQDPLTAADVDDHIAAIRPSRTAGCPALLVALAALGQLMGQVVAGDEPDPADVGLTSEIDGARRDVMARLQDQDCLADAGVRELRDSFVSIHEPLPDDPDDVETRAYAFLSDVREAYFEHEES